MSKYKIPGLLLMEAAGKAVAEDLVLELGSEPQSGRKRVAVICGPGNNGGDGFVVARWLFHWGYALRLVLLCPRASYGDDARANFDMVLSLLPKDSIHHGYQSNSLLQDGALDDSDMIVDAIFGTGLNRELSPTYASLINQINNSQKNVYSLDIPSGLCATRGRSFGAVIRAKKTYCFGYLKTGLVNFPGFEKCGEVKVVDIGLPRELEKESGLFQGVLIQQRNIKARLKDYRQLGHKGAFGHVLSIAGSPGMKGAALLSSKGALRMGAGLCTVAMPEENVKDLDGAVPELMTRRFSILNGEEVLSELLPKKTALLLGPGLLLSSDESRVLLGMIKQCQLPTVIDAGALQGIANLGDESPWQELSLGGPIILTPHPGEMAQLLNSSIKEIQANRPEIAMAYAQKHQIYLVLKGARTLLATPEGRLFVNSSGNSRLSSGGTGDVLAGMIAGLLAQKYSAEDAVLISCYIHGKVAERLRGKTLIASDIIEAIPAAVSEVVTSG